VGNSQNHSLNIQTFVQALRPKQWIKNFLVLAAPIASGEFFANFWLAISAFISFVFTSSLGYLANDWRDREADWFHPKKRARPFASGLLGLRHLIFLMMICSVFATIPLFFLPRMFVYVLSAYLLITFSYSYVIKSIPVLEMLWISTGFLIRALAGSVVISQPPTGWFVTTVFFGSLFMISSKRIAETRKFRKTSTRKVISAYPEGFLNATSTMSLGVTITTYCLWVFEVHPESSLAQISILPFAYSVLMYLYCCDKGDAEAPEDLLFSNRYLLISISITILLLFLVF
jgi:decaprenyl-phosphate phosphoribosyltransferase